MLAKIIVYKIVSNTYMKKIYIIGSVLVVLAIVGRLVISQQGSVETVETEITAVAAPVSTEALSYAEEDVSFENISTGFTHSFDSEYSQFLGGTAIDLNNDETQEIYVTGGADQNDAYLVYENGTFVDKISELGITNTQASYGVISTDIDNNGSVDLFIARQDGVYAYYQENGVFEEYKIPVSFERDAVPVDITVGDIDNDGDFDLYISTFITASKFRSATFNDPNHVQKNVLLRNDGERVFTDITEESGLVYSQNTFTASFIELNNDGFIDLVVSPNTDQVKIYRNNNGVFTLEQEVSTYGFWMGIGIDDIDNDGDVDLFFSNSGTTVPKRLATGDLRADQNFDVAYSLLRNDGEFAFTDITDQINDGLPFGWGIVAHDFDGDNQSEWLVMQNYIKWPGHKLNKGPGTLLKKTNNGYEQVIRDFGLDNRNYGFSALIGDFTGDDIQDVAYLNVDGPLRVLAGEAELINKRVDVLVADDASSQGLHFELELDGTVIKKAYNPKQGIMTDQASSVSFSLGNQEQALLRVLKNGGELQTLVIEKDQQIVDLR